MVFAGSSHTVALLRFSCFGRPRRARGPVASDWDSRPGSWPVPPPRRPPPCSLSVESSLERTGPFVSSSGPSVQVTSRYTTPSAFRLAGLSRVTGTGSARRSPGSLCFSPQAVLVQQAAGFQAAFAASGGGAGLFLVFFLISSFYLTLGETRRSLGLHLKGGSGRFQNLPAPVHARIGNLRRRTVFGAALEGLC